MEGTSQKVAREAPYGMCTQQYNTAVSHGYAPATTEQTEGSVKQADRDGMGVPLHYQ